MLAVTNTPIYFLAKYVKPILSPLTADEYAVEKGLIKTTFSF